MKDSTQAHANGHILGTATFELDVDVETGRIQNLVFLANGLHPWNDVLQGEEIHRRIAGVMIRDELTGLTFRDEFGSAWIYYDEARKERVYPPGTRCRVENFQSSMEEEIRKISFTKRFEGSTFDIRYTLTSNETDLRWDLEFVLDRGAEPRSLEVFFLFPTPAEPMEVHPDHRPPWMLWAPAYGAPYPFANVAGWGHSGSSWDIQRFPYSAANSGNGIGVPVIDVYSEKHDVGLAIAAPFDLRKPEFSFEVDKLHGQIRVIYSNLGLRPGGRPMASVWMHAHAGDWRPALGWLFQKYPEYFTAGDQKIVSQEGPMSYSFPVLTEAVIESWKRDMHFKWTELLYLPTFGDFVPESAEWTFDMMAADDDPKHKLSLNRQKVADHLKLLKKHGVSSFAYFNVCEYETVPAEEKFPDSMMRLSNGRRRPGWIWPNGRRNWNLCPDPRSKWGQYVLQQLEALFQTYPDLDGIFFDQLCYRTYDFSKDDGMTLVHNRACLDTHAVFPEMVARVVEVLRRYGKTAFTNGPYNVEVQKGLDGIMCEGDVEGLAKYSHMCLAKPVMILTYGSALPQFEHTLKVCLKYSAFPDVRDHLTLTPRAEISNAERELYRRYLPLLEELRGRRWVFEPHALTLPPGYDGNIFTNRAGRYVVTVYPVESLRVDRDNAVPNREIRLRLRTGNVGTVQWLSTETSERRELPLSMLADGRYAVSLPEYSDASVLVI